MFFAFNRHFLSWKCNGIAIPLCNPNLPNKLNTPNENECIFDPLLQIVSVSQNSTCCAAESKNCSLVIEMSDHLSGTNISYAHFHFQTDSQVN